MALKVGVVGCGNISDIYLKNSSGFKEFEIVACADLEMEKAVKLSETYGIAKVLTVEEITSSDEADIILNLTIPKSHAKVSFQAIEKGKHVYSEKPFAISFEDGKRIVQKAKQNNVIVCSAPDTFLGGSIQLAGELIEDGVIGKLVGATAFMMSRGPESWHPNPEFFYQEGGGPMYDMGPYYLTALVSLMGPVSRVAGSAHISFPERTITSPGKHGEKITVQVPTHVSGLLEFHNGATASITTSFDVSAARTPFIEIYGENGTISLPDPNQFNQPLLVKKYGEDTWKECQPSGKVDVDMRGIGLADMADAIEKGRTARADGRKALHVLEIMHGIHRSSEEGKHYIMENVCKKPLLLKEKSNLKA